MKLTQLILPLLAVAAATGCSSSPQIRKLAEAPTEPLSWVELGPDSTVIARVITGDAACPVLRLDGGKGELPMAVRAEPDQAYAVRVCEALVPPGTRTAQLGSQNLALPSAHPRKILFIGDTGCRISLHDGKPDAQLCNDPKAWPFPTLAKNESMTDPDLIVHLGDYLYREIPCPEGNAYCAGSPSGNNWETWNADFFAAAKPLLGKAPWIFVRGNHELCKRAGEGWFRFLDPSPLHACSDTTDPYHIKRGDAEFVVLDSALATDVKPPAEQIEAYRGQFEKIAAMPLQHAWLITHRPMWAPALTNRTDPNSPIEAFNQTLQSATKNQLPKGIKATLCGHLHLFEEFHFADGRPPQFIAGNGGTLLTASPIKEFKGMAFAGTTVTSGSLLDQFGFFIAEAQKDGQKGSSWDGTAYDLDGRPRLFCRGIGSSHSCVDSPQR